MKITHRGTPATERVWFGTCISCKSEAEAFESELTHITHDQREGSFSWEKCPVCNSGSDSKFGFYGGILFHPK